MIVPLSLASLLAAPALALAFSLTGMPSASAQEFTFDGDDLDPAWQVVRPDPESYIVEDGKLLIVAASTGTYADKTAANVFEYSLPDASGNWTAEIVLDAEMQTGSEAIVLGVANDKSATTILASLYTGGDKYHGWSLNVGIYKASAGKATSFAKVVAALGCNVCGPDRMFPNFVETIKQPITLQLVKEGRHYHARAKLSGPNDDWVETEKVTLLRSAPKLVFFATQNSKNNGETLFFIDKISVAAN